MAERITSGFLRSHFQADYVAEVGGWDGIRSAVLAARRVLSNPEKFPRADFKTLERVDVEGTSFLLRAPIQFIV